jgi:vacuolar-type H+-ATPase subunit F/Vma7
VTWRVRAVTGPALAAGFRLSGIAADEVPDADAAAARVGALGARGDVGIILVEQRLLDDMGDAARREVERRAVPIVVPVPAPEWEAGRGAAEDIILELLRRAIGYRVRLR